MKYYRADDTIVVVKIKSVESGGGWRAAERRSVMDGGGLKVVDGKTSLKYLEQNSLSIFLKFKIKFKISAICAT